MEESISSYLDKSIEVVESLRDKTLQKQIETSIDHIVECFRAKGTLLVCGNGGSATDAEHITGELVGRFYKDRKPFKVVCLNSTNSVITAWANDFDYSDVFARQVNAYFDTRGTVLLGLSTSGNSKNVVAAFDKAKSLGCCTISLSGQTGGDLLFFSDVCIRVNSKSTPLIQQAHQILYHYICYRLEEKFFGDE